jgi:hypothetical protein
MPGRAAGTYGRTVMERPRRLPLVRSALVLAALFLLAQAPGALAASGSITNVHRLANGQVEATYTTNFDICSGSFCGWYPHAWQVPASQPCSEDDSHLTYVGDYHNASGSETATDPFSPAFSGSIRICLYAYQSGTEHFIADAVFDQPTNLFGSITDVHPVGDGRYEATYTTNFDLCSGSYCGWYAHAWQLPESQPCSEDDSHLTYVGEIHDTSGSETETDDFTPAYSGGIRLCLYAHHGGDEYLIAETVFYHYTSPAPTQPVATVVGDQQVSFFVPRGCVPPGRDVLLRVVTKTKRDLIGRRPHVYAIRIVFSLDSAKKTDRKKKWRASFPTAGFASGGTHTVRAKITFRHQKTREKFVRRISRTFQIC